MKFKDIKQNLKNEHEQKSVPDVFSRVRKAPINRLLTGQKPLKAFDKALAVRLLWIVAALLIVSVLAFFALAVMQDNEQAEPFSYVRLSVERDGKTQVYGFVVNNDRVSVCVLENDGNGSVLNNLGKQDENIENAISDVYQSKYGDKVRVCVLNSNEKIARELAVLIKDSVSASGGDAVSVSYFVNDGSVKNDVAVICGADAGESTDTIVNRYLEKFLQ